MAEVTTENIFLKETPLTSTKNKFLDSDFYEKWCPNLRAFKEMKRKYDFMCLESPKTKDDSLTSIKNKFLKKDTVSNKISRPEKCKRSFTIVKKKMCAKGKSRPLRSTIRYLHEPLSELDRVDSPGSRSRSRSIDSSSVDETCELEHESQASICVFSAPSAPPAFSFGSTAASIAPPNEMFLPDAPSTRRMFRSPCAAKKLISLKSASQYGLYRDLDYPASERNVLPGPIRGGAAVPVSKLSFQQPVLFGAAAIYPTIAQDISEMPVYSFDSGEEYKHETCESFSFVNTEANDLQFDRVRRIKSKKMQFLNAVSMALIYNANLKNVDDEYRKSVQKYADDVIGFDPEFILKVALFSRQELNIRAVSNFLLSYAAYCENTRPYLEKYFAACIRLPSDWIEVADFYETFEDSRLKTRSLPSALKKVMVKCFAKFDEYQLAKYNRVKKELGYTLKQLIRLLHLKSPANEIMCLLGKKYPDTAEVFRKSGLPGIWDHRRAGQRMKLPIPETWETQISANGNKACVWEKLIDNGKLPYMAMLRNLKNLILSGLSQKHHEKVQKQLENKIAVIKSRQSPLQFYEAFKVLTLVEDIYLGNVKPWRHRDPMWKMERMEKLDEKIKNVSLPLLETYKHSLSAALEISALHNLQPIPGKSLVICDILFPSSLDDKKRIKMLNLCIMMGLMCLKACEDCKMNVIRGSFTERVILTEDRTFLESVESSCIKYESSNGYESSNSVDALKGVLEYYLKQYVTLTEKLDHVIFLRASQSDDNDKMKTTVKSFLHKYREVVNPDLLYTDVDFHMSKSSFTFSDTSDGKDVYLGGNTTQLIKFIAERSSGGQLAYVENIDVKYDLVKDTNTNRYNNLKTSLVSENLPKLPLLTRVPKWHTVRIFISSTFKDMHSERDMLIRFVMPELKKRAASIFVKINELDLRWGITESDCASKRAAELCLLEAQKSDLFIGIIGERYGTIYNFDPPDAPELQWVKEHPKGLSITELEMYAGALRENKLKEKRAHFYFRNNSFMSQIPEKWKSYFDSEDPESKQKVEALKSKILSSGLKVHDGYLCRFAGLLNGKPVLSELESFGKSVLNDMWSAVKEMHDKDPYVDDFIEEEICQQHLFGSLDYVVEIKNSPMEDLIKQIRKDSGIFLITGTPGSGKTTFVVNMLQKMKNFTVIKFFVGLSPRSTELSFMLQYISNSIGRIFPVSSVFPKLNRDVMNQFPDILQEAVSSSANSDFALVIDGLDHLPFDDQMLDWLPLNLPEGLRLICTASDSSCAFQVLSERSPVQIQTLSVISQSDRTSIVKNYLKLYGKSLDESSFNNQMLLMITKKDSGIPLYLRLSCDFLRRYASFENFMSMLQSLPSAMSLLLQEIILQMENEFGSILVQTALILLCITKEGLDDADLHLLLSLVLIEKEKGTLLTYKSAIDQITKLKPDNMLSQVTYCSLVHTICSFAYGHNRFKKFTLFGSEFEKAVQKFYVNKNYQNFSKSMHCTLAAYYYSICDPEKCGTWNGRSGSAFRGLIFHLFYGRCYLELADYLCCLRFLEAIFSVEVGSFLLEYYSLLFDESHTGSSEITRKINFPLLSSFDDFVSRNLHIFQMYPNLVLQQALNEPSESLVKSNIDNNNVYKLPIVKCLTQCELDPRVATLSGFFKNITAASYHNVTRHVLLGSEDGYLKVLDVASKKIIRSVKSHASAITFICLAGRNRICTASTDTTLSLWNSIDYSRISVLKGHRHIVSGCCGDSSSSILLSSGWDNSVRLWSLRDGSVISVIDFECPVNCLDHHPLKQQVACGLWNGNIEIWDTVSLQRNSILLNNSSSVKSIAFTSDGINIISSYINSDVIIWSSEQSLKISSLKGHALPVKSISCSPLGDMIVSGSDDCTLKVWPTESGHPISTFSACKFCPISLLEIISPNYLAIAFQNSDVWVLDMSTGFIVTKMTVEADITSCFSKYDSATYASKEKNWVDFSLVFGTQAGKILVGNLTSSEITTVGNIKSRITSLIHNKSIIVCGSGEGGIRLFSYPELSCRVVSTGAHSGSVTALSLFNKDNNVWIMSTGSDKIIKLWEIDFEEIVMKEDFQSKHFDVVTCCKYYGSLDGHFLTGSHDNTVILESRNKESIFEGLKTSVINVDYSDKYIVGCGSDGSIALWSTDGKILSCIPGVEQSSVVLSFRIDKDISGEFDITLAFVDKDGSVKIRKPNQRSFSYSLEGHNRGITSCCLSQNREILSCSLDGTVNLWKIPSSVQDIHLYHSASVTGICISLSQKIIISSDAHGNIVLWKLILSTSVDSPLVYAGKKSYIGGFVKSVSFLKDKSFVCAVTQVTNGTDTYFLDVISSDCNASGEDSLYSLQVKSSHSLKSEVLCLDTDPKTETIVAGLKSGHFIIITPNTKKILALSEDWILGVQLLSISGDSPKYLFTSLLNGSIKRIQMSEIHQRKDYDSVSLEEIEHTDFGSDSPYVSSFCCESETSVYCGDSQGWLRRYSDAPVSKKIHDDSITGISKIGCYVFTCSLDRTLKGWDSSLKQVCQFHSSVPITNIVGRQVKLTKSLSTYMLVIGTSSGAVQCLHFHDGKI